MLRFWTRKAPSQGARITLPDTGHIYAIGDVHGCLSQFNLLQEQIFKDGDALPGRKLVITIGDYIDRGPASAGVLDALLKPLPDGFSRISLKGNHEAMMLDAYDTGDADVWLSVGGAETLASYGIAPDNFLPMNRKTRKQVMAAFIPSEHIDLLRSMPVSVTVGDYLFVHAGVRPGIVAEKQIDEDLLWIREPFLSTPHGLPLTVVHGHTPAPQVVQTAYRIGLDTGAYAGGPLSALRIGPGRELKVFSA